MNKEQFIEDYNRLTYEQLAKKYQVSRSTIRNLVKELNLEKPVGRKKKVIFED